MHRPAQQKEQIMFDAYESLDKLSQQERAALRQVNADAITRIEALHQELTQLSDDAGLSNDTTVDYIAGYLQLALEHAKRLRYRLEHE
jgi:hypothetical protein